MSTLYPQIQSWVIANDVLVVTRNAVWPAGKLGRESGAFWLGERAEIAKVYAVVLPLGAGVEGLPFEWRVSPEVFGAVTRWAKPKKLTLLGIAHTHLNGVSPLLSWADRHLSVQVPGILAVVIGNSGALSDHRKWGWYVYESGGYRRMRQNELAKRIEILPQGEVEIVYADAHGVWK